MKKMAMYENDSKNPKKVNAKKSAGYENKRKNTSVYEIGCEERHPESGIYSEPRTSKQIRKSILENLHLTSMVYTDKSKSDVQNWMGQLAASTSQPGIKYVIEEKGVLKYVWIVLLVAMSVLFFWQFVDSLAAFHKRESYTSIEYQVMDNLSLPAVTICNVNSAKYSKVKAIEPQLIDLLTAFTRLGLGYIQPEQVELLYNDTVRNAMSNYTFWEFLSEVGHNLPDMFVRCAMSQVAIPCEDYFTLTATNIGMCYTFNSQELIKRTGVTQTSDEPGPFDGINLTIDVEPKEYLVTNGLGEGIVVNIHSPKVHPFIHSNSIYLPPGEESFIKLEMVDQTILSTPYSKRECIPPEELEEKGQELLGFRTVYSEDVCRLVCFVDNVYGCGGCNPLGIQTAACTMWQAFICAVQNFHRVNQFKQCNCPPACQQTKYNYQLSHIKFPNTFATNTLNKHTNSTEDDGQISKRYLQLHIYYDSNVYTKIEQRPVTTIFLLLSNLGGTMGLYLGSSVVTLLEFIYLFMIFIYHKCFKN